MSERLRDWLPDEAAVRPAVRARAQGVVSGWAAHWFAHQPPALGAWELAAEERRPADGARRDCGGGVQVGCSQRAALRLACAAVGARAEEVELTDRDRRVLSAFADRMVDDLVRRLREQLGLVAPEGLAQGWVLARVSDADDTLLTVAIRPAALTAVSRQALPKRRPAETALQPRNQAVTSTSVRLEATLGVARLDLSAVRDLAVGDVIILDRAVSDPLELSVAGTPVGLGVLGDVDGQSALILQCSE